MLQKLLLVLIAIVLNFPLIGQPFAPNTVRGPELPCSRNLVFNPDLKPFYHGVASGDPGTESVVLWTRVTPEGPVSEVLVDYFIATDTGFQNMLFSGSAVATEINDFTLKIAVQGLAPDAVYYYYFRAEGSNSLIGRARTCPEGAVDHLRFGVVSCANYEGGYFNAYGHLAGRNDLNAVVHLGDYIYEYGTGVYGFNFPDRMNDPEYEILTLSDYRTRYAQYRLDPDLIRFHQQHTMIAVWDDHESANDSWKDGAQNHQTSEGLWEERKAISKQVYFEWMPVANNAEKNVYRKISYGNLCDLIMLDTRLEGRVEPPLNFDDPDVPVRPMISDSQMNWLLESLQNSPAKWKVIGNQVLFSTFNIGFAGGAFDGSPDPTNIDSIRVVENLFIDNWESYPTQRNAIIDSLRNQGINNVVIVSGDSHCSWAFDVTKQAVNYPNPATLYLPQPNPYNTATGEGYDKTTGAGSWAVEFATPSISSPNFDETLGGGVSEQVEAYLAQPIAPFNLEYNPHLKYVDLDRHGYILLDLLPDTAQANYYYVPSQLIDSVGGYFGTAAFTAAGQNHVQIRGEASIPGQDFAPAPVLPFGVSGTKTVAQPFAFFGLSPNPASTSTMLQIGLNETTSLEVIISDRSGKIVKRVAPVQFAPGLLQYRLELPVLPSGIYVVSIVGANGWASARLLQIK